MAGYNFPGDMEFKNGTLINTQADREGNGQRVTFKNSNNDLGAANMTVLDSIFGSHFDSVTGPDKSRRAMEDVIINMRDLSSQAITDDNGNAIAVGNPDFQDIVHLDYSSGKTEFDNSTLEDKPNEFTPNTSVPSTNTFDPETARATQTPEEGEGPLTAPKRTEQFGFSIVRNTRGDGTIGGYFNNYHNNLGDGRNVTVVKGEFDDVNELSY